MSLETLARGRAELVTATPDTSAMELAKLMAMHDVGSVLIEENDRVNFPLGIVTDRDLALAVVGEDRPASGTIARDVMTTDLVTADVEDGVFEVCQTMSEHGVRRLPLVDGDELVGILTLDDLFVLLEDEMKGLSSVIKAESPAYR